jgi:hypothetical protein
MLTLPVPLMIVGSKYDAYQVRVVLFIVNYIYFNFIYINYYK